MLKRLIRRLTSVRSQHGAPPQPPKPARLPHAPQPRQRFSAEAAIVKQPLNKSGKPKISLIVVVYNMPDQADNTLASLTATYQLGVSADDYEVLVMENNSKHNLGEERATRHGPNFRYYLRHETEPTPVHAINFAVENAKADYVGIVIDGARMLSPGVISFTLAALNIAHEPVICVPGYHLGPKLQQVSMLEGYDQAREQKLLESIGWPRDGYRLFEISCFSGTSSGGFFKPFSESNCLCMSKEVYREIGGCDTRFNETGGGQVNLDLYKRACELEHTTLITLIGEGSFHQFHGGITTGQQGGERVETMKRHFAQYANIRGEAYTPPAKRPILFGSVSDNMLPFILHSANNAIHVINKEEQ